MALANSVTLQLAGINKNTPTPVGGEIVKDPATGEPTGVLKDEAWGWCIRSFLQQLKKNWMNHWKEPYNMPMKMV